MDNVNVLFLSANPIGTPKLSLDIEVRSIKAKIRAAEYRNLTIETVWAARPDDLLQMLNEQKPHIVHFSGHGNMKDEIILLDEQDNPKPVSKIALVSLFKVLKGNVRLVVLNACFSEPQALAITQEIDCAIGMHQSIGDSAA